MARIYKITLYLIDPYDMYGNRNNRLDRIIEDIDKNSSLLIAAFDGQESIFEWSDDLEINRFDSSKTAHEKYFK